MKVIDEEHIQIEDEALEGLTQVSKGDMRQALSILQECFSSGTYAQILKSPVPFSRLLLTSMSFKRPSR
jgi:DNA polymerase III gamma/tau subunit